MAGVEIEAVAKRFGATAAVEQADLFARDGAFVALLGPSGCGKTTLLRLIAGFEMPDEGEIRFGGDVVSRAGWMLAPEDRGIGMVFQSYALWPHMTAAGNVGFALKVRGVPKTEREAKVAKALETVGLAGMGERRPASLSGGQRQRVALARCLAMEPRLILLDEPLANLDAHLREAMQSEFRRFHREAGTTFIYVTHDQAEAMALADEIAVMDRGRIVQTAPPARLYAEPASAMVAGFIGGGMVVDGVVRTATENGAVVAALGATFCARGEGREGKRVRICLRPSDLSTGTAQAGIPATVTDVRFQGARSIISARGEDGTMLNAEHVGAAPRIGERIGLAVGDAWIIPQAGS